MNATLPAPAKAPALRVAALAATAAEDWAEAGLLWAQLAEAAPRDAEARLRHAEALFFAGQRTEAAAIARIAARLAPRDARPALLVARAEPSPHSWRQVLALLPESLEALLGLAETQLEAGRPGPALDVLLRALALAAADPLAHALAARVLAALSPRQRAERLKQAQAQAAPDAALALLHVAAQLDPGDIRGQWALAQALLARDATEQALAPLRTVVQAAPHATEPLQALARALHRAGDWDAAIPFWQRLVKRRPKDVEAALSLAQALRRAGRPDAALPLLARLPATPATLREQARALAELGRDAESDAAWATLLDAAPEDLALRRDHAAHLLRQGREDEARAALEALVGKPPGYGRPALLLLRLMLRRGEAVAAIERFAAAIAGGLPARPDATALEITLRLGIAMLDHGHPAEAARMIEAARPLPGAPARLALRAGLRLALAQGEDSAARALAEQAIAAAPEDTSPWREALVAFAEQEDSFAATLLARAEPLFAGRDAEWLRLCEAAGPACPDATRRAALARAAPRDPALRLRASRMALRLGALGEATRLLGEDRPPAALGAAWARHAAQLAVARSLAPDVAQADLPAAIIGWFAALPVLPPGGPAVLVHDHLATTEAPLAATLLALARQGAPVRLMCRRLTAQPQRRALLPALEAAGVPVIDAASLEPVPLPAEAQALLDLLAPGIAARVARLHAGLAEARPGLVHLWRGRGTVVLALAALLAGVPRLVLALRPAATPPRPALAALVRLLGERLTLLAPSPEAAAALAAWLGVAADRVAVLAEGQDFDRVLADASAGRAAALRAELRLAPDAPLLAGVQPLTEPGAPLAWLEAVAPVLRARPEAQAVLLGEGPLRPAVLAEARRLGLDARLHLPGPAETLPWLRAASLLLHAAPAMAPPGALLHAQALGRPVLALRSPGSEAALEDGLTGALAEAADLPAEALALLGNRPWLEQARLYAPAWVGARFSAAASAGALAALYGLPAPASAPGWSPPPGEAEREAAHAAARAEDWAAAEAAWDQVLALRGADAEALMGAGQARFQRGRYAEARALLARALSLRPEAEALRWLARTLRALREDREALPLWSALLAEAPADLEARLRACEARARLGDLPGAIELAEAGRGLLGEDARLRRLLARLHQEATDPAAALTHWNALAEAAPQDSEAQFQAGRMAALLGQPALARQRLGVALASPTWGQRAAVALAPLLPPAEARAVLRPALRRAPGDLGLWQAAYAAARPAVVARHLARLRRGPALRWAAHLEQAGHMAEARAAYEAMAERAPEAAERLLRLLLRQGEATAAQAVAGRFPTLPAGLRNEAAAAARFAGKLLAETGAPEPREAFWRHLARGAARRGHPRYLPQPGAALRLAAGFDLGPWYSGAGAALARLPELAVPGGAFGEALRPPRTGPLAAALLGLRPQEVELPGGALFVEAAQAALAVGVPRLLLPAETLAEAPPALLRLLLVENAARLTGPVEAQAALRARLEVAR